MKRLAILIPLLFASYAMAQTCNGASPTWTAATASAADVQACFNKTLHCGDTIIASRRGQDVVNGTDLEPANWVLIIYRDAHSGHYSTGRIDLYGRCSAGSEGIGLAISNVTNITTSVASLPALAVTGCSNTSSVRITGFSFTNTTGGGTPLNGAINISGAHGQVCGRLDHINVANNAGTFFTAGDGYGLVDHVLYVGGGTEYTFSAFTGDFSSHGYLNWQDATNLGSNEFLDYRRR